MYTCINCRASEQGSEQGKQQALLVSVHLLDLVKIFLAEISL